MMHYAGELQLLRHLMFSICHEHLLYKTQWSGDRAQLLVELSTLEIEQRYVH